MEDQENSERISQALANEQEISSQLRERLLDQQSLTNQRMQTLLEGRGAPAEVKEVLIKAERALSDIREISWDRPYALVLIDGDGCIFNPKFLRQGLLGGELVGELLLQKIHDHFNDCRFLGQRGWQIIVRIFANVEGLAGALKKCGRVSESTLLSSFVVGLTHSDPYIDFVDVGPTKEAADFKIKALLDHYAPDINVRCQHVMLGCANDHGYLRMLAPYKHRLK